MDNGLLSDNFDIPAALSGLLTGRIQGTGHFYGARFSAVQDNTTILIGMKGSGFYHTGIIDYGVHDTVCTGRRHNHRAAIG